MRKNVLLVILIFLIGYLIYKGIQSSKSINKTLDQGLEVIKNYTKLEEVDIGEYKKINIKNVFPFYTNAYKIENIGFLAILSINIGISQVFSFHLSPYEKDFPILIIDYMSFFGFQQAIFEAYNTTLDKNNDLINNFIEEFEELKKSYSDLKDWEISPKWSDDRIVAKMSKKGYDSKDNRFKSLFSDVIEIYMKNIMKMPKLEGDERNNKSELIKEFAEQMAKNGGIASTIFKSSMKEEDVIKLFVNIFFGYSFK